MFASSSSGGVRRGPFADGSGEWVFGAANAAGWDGVEFTKHPGRVGRCIAHETQPSILRLAVLGVRFCCIAFTCNIVTNPQRLPTVQDLL